MGGGGGELCGACTHLARTQEPATRSQRSPRLQCKTLPDLPELSGGPEAAEAEAWKPVLMLFSGALVQAADQGKRS